MPLHYYFIQAMDAMYANLTHERAAAAVAGGAHGAARRHAGRGAADHRGQRAADRGDAGVRAMQITFSGNTVTIPELIAAALERPRANGTIDGRLA